LIGSDTPYLLYVGKPIARHNIRSMLEAFGRLVRKKGIGSQFLVIGTSLPGINVAALVKNLGLEDRVVMIGHADHDLISRAYAAADLSVYASSYEGFGIPVLESMACGTPTITLNNSAFPEFAGGVALLADDARPETLAAAMERVLTDGALREQMRRDGPIRAQQYLWPDIARKTMDVIRSVAG
jgi:glycosyltransferase involved in cell wall biosynthesis